MYIINDFNLRIIGENLFNNNEDYFMKNYSYIGNNDVHKDEITKEFREAMFNYIHLNFINSVHYIEAYCDINENLFLDESPDVVNFIYKLIYNYIELKSNLKEKGIKEVGCYIFYKGYDKNYPTRTNGFFSYIIENEFSFVYIFMYLNKLATKINSINYLLRKFMDVLSGIYDKDIFEEIYITDNLKKVYYYLLENHKFDYNEYNIFEMFLDKENLIEFNFMNFINSKENDDYILDFNNIALPIYIKYIIKLNRIIHNFLRNHYNQNSYLNICFDIESNTISEKDDDDKIFKNHPYVNDEVLEFINHICILEHHDLINCIYVDPTEFKDYYFDKVLYSIDHFDEKNTNICINLIKGDKVIKRLDFYDYTPIYYKTKIKEFLEFIITSNEINNRRYEEILSTIGFKDDINEIIRDNVNIINKDKLDILKKIGMETEFAEV